MARSIRMPVPPIVFPSERAIQLRREAVAAMRLRIGGGSRCNFLPLNAGTSRDAPQIRILTISDYEGLRNSREQVLRMQGFYVESVPSRARFDVAWVRSFDIAVFCQSVEHGRAMRIATQLRALHPGIALLRIHPTQASIETGSL